MKARDLIRAALERAARRGITTSGGALLVSGDQLTVALGVALILGEYAFEQWRENRKLKKAGG